jgi:16S rRNA processing protein RimM
VFVEDCYCLGFVHKAQGIAGELVIKTELEQSEENITKWESIFLSIDGILVPFFIENIYLKSSNLIVVKLEDVENEIDVQKFRSLEVYVDKDLFKAESSSLGFVKWLNFEIIDSAYGLVGTLEEVQEFPSQLMLQVKSKQNQMHLIPANQEWLVGVDEDKRTIEMQLPDGLLALNE